ncbi:hypothetical protein BU15DRAFT_74126 [Melanogaster broomeanus]|nr:hypothetical protein BU15DRAFT_74126 [Melanogaster broomeanus]
MSGDYDYLSGRNASRDYNESANYYEGRENPRPQGTDDDSALSGAHGGSGYGQAGGYRGSQQRQQVQQGYDDTYGGYDPGMAGCGSDDTQACSIPGAGRIGGERYESTYYDRSGSLGTGAGARSRGYERDADEYDPTDISRGRGPSVSDRVKGGMEKMAGRAIRDPNLEARGEQRQVSA